MVGQSIVIYQVNLRRLSRNRMLMLPNYEGILGKIQLYHYKTTSPELILVLTLAASVGKDFQRANIKEEFINLSIQFTLFLSLLYYSSGVKFGFSKLGFFSASCSFCSFFPITKTDARAITVHPPIIEATVS